MEILNKDLRLLLEQGKKVKLHLGSGSSLKTGYYNLDIIRLQGVDIIADMNQPLDLIPDNSVSCVYTQHALEHIKNLQGLMQELSRICCSDAIITIVVPHFSNPYYYSDPTHIRPFGLYSMSYFVNEEDQLFKRKVPAYYTNTRFKLLDTRLFFYRTSLIDRILVPIIRFIVNLNNSTKEIYERRWPWLYPAWQIKYTLRVK
ncbi:methyltransferase type 11 [Candidatus Woesearchaeota archaeon]|jgi:ubiquinone/menaquinone biosynthesis C-methylase UbiE|nr:methyltransferase type 11 [Candidatus Woesearchaeota archaeon]